MFIFSYTLFMDDNIVKKTLLTSAISAALLCGSMTAAAGEFYVGAGIGTSSIDVTASDFDGGSFTSDSFDDSDSTFRIFAGYNLNDSIAIEAGYTDLGSYSLAGSFDGSDPDLPAGPTSATFDVTGWEFSAVGSLPLTEQISLLGRLGFIMWDTDVDVTTTDGSGSDSDDGTNILYGVGGAYSFTDNLDARLEYTRYDADDNIDVFSASLVMKF